MQVILGECVVAQHKLVVADFRFHARVMRDKGTKITRTKWWKLKGEAQQTFQERMIMEGPWDEEGDADSMWVKMGTCIRKVAREVLGVTKGKKPEAKGTWWWNEDVQRAIKRRSATRVGTMIEAHATW